MLLKTVIFFIKLAKSLFHLSREKRFHSYQAAIKWYQAQIIQWEKQHTAQTPPNPS